MAFALTDGKQDMKNIPWFAALLAVAMFSGRGSVAAEDGAGFTQYFGYPKCIQLKNDRARVILCAEGGGRILEYSWEGKNALYVDLGQKGWSYERDKPAVNPCGGRFDIGPEMTTVWHPELWLGKWKGEILGPRSARLTSVKDPATGTQLIREFTLDPSSSKLCCKQIIQNASERTISWCHWSRTLAVGGGICIIPLTPNSRFPRSYIRYGPGPVMDYQPDDPNVRVRKGFLEVIGVPKEPKLGFDSQAGWLCYLMKNDLMFVKRFPTYPDRVYNEMASLTLAIWYFKDLMCELEPIGPMERLAPGQSAAFTETWWLIPYKYPGDANEVKTEEISRIVERQGR